MQLIQQLPSKTGNFRNNVIEGVREVYASKVVMPGTNVAHDAIVCELPFGKRYAIGYFPSVEYRDDCLNYIDNNKYKSSLIIPLEDFFMQDYLSNELVEFVLENYTLQGYFQNLFKVHFSRQSVTEIRDMDAFINYTPQDIIQMRKGNYVSVKNLDSVSTWSRTLPISSELLSYGITKKQYFNNLIKKHENNIIPDNTRITYGLSAQHISTSHR